jgi:ABC-2 type transport system permease protein
VSTKKTRQCSQLPAGSKAAVSGTYVPLMALPAWMLTIGSIFPVKWMAQGFRSVLLPADMAAFEPAGSWEHWWVFLVLTAWSIGGLIACLAVFRWSDQK